MQKRDMSKWFIRQDTTKRWLDINPIMDVMDLGYDTELKIFKIGDGKTKWTDLPKLKLTIC